MSKTIMRSMVILAVLAMCACVVFAEGLPNSKATAAINTLVKCRMDTAQTDDNLVLPDSCVDLFSGAEVQTDDAWIPIMSSKVKLSSSQSLFVSPSLVSGLYTRTRTKTQTGSTSTAEAMGAVYLRAVLLDEAGVNVVRVAEPLAHCTITTEDSISYPSPFGCYQSGTSGGFGVVLDSRIQTLSQTLSACVIDVTDIEGPNNGSCTFTSTLDLILRTASANTFNFIFPAVGQGIYKLQIYAALGAGASIIEGSGTAVGAAAFGLGSMTVETVRLVHDFEF